MKFFKELFKIFNFDENEDYSEIDLWNDDTFWNYYCNKAYGQRYLLLRYQRYFELSNNDLPKNTVDL